MFAAIVEWLKGATWQRYLITVVSILTFIALYTVYENRQEVYSEIITPPRSLGDFALPAPGEAGRELFRAFTKRRPEVLLITVIDADPIKNRRTPVYRHFNSPELERYILAEEARGRDGSGLLWGVDPVANRQTMSIFNVEVLCDDGGAGFFARAFPDVPNFVGTSCRVALPPLLELTTGWLSIHIAGKVDANDPEFKMELLNLAMAYYRAEILPLQK